MNAPLPTTSERTAGTTADLARAVGALALGTALLVVAVAVWSLGEETWAPGLTAPQALAQFDAPVVGERAIRLAERARRQTIDAAWMSVALVGLWWFCRDLARPSRPPVEPTPPAPPPFPPRRRPHVAPGP